MAVSSVGARAAAALEGAGSFLTQLTGWRRRAATFVAGACGALSMAPVYATPLLVVSFSALILLLDGAAATAQPRRAAFSAGWWFGLGYFVAGIYWMAFSFFVQAKEFAWMAPFAVFGLPAFLGLFTGCACAVAMALWRPGWRRIALFAVVWMGAEFLRGHVLTGLPWNLPGQAFAGAPLLAQSAAWYGVYGLSFAAVLIAAAPAVWIGASLPPRRVLAGAGVSLLGFCVLLGVGAARLAAIETPALTANAVRIVQPNIPQREKIDPSYWRRNFDRLLEMSAFNFSSALTDGAERIFIVWPENAVPLLDEAYGPLGDMDAALPSRAVVIAGAVRRETDASGKTRFFNSIAIAPRTAAGRRVVAHYDKHHLVPFGEYLPLKGLLEAIGLAQLAPYDDGFTRGEGPRVMNAGGPSFAPLICYEAIFPGALYPREERPAWLLTVTNDAWFGDTSGPRQHLDQARLRAIETGLPMVRAANTGISAVIDAKGRVLARKPLYQAGVIDYPLPGAMSETIYHKFGDLLFFLMLALGGALIAAPARYFRPARS
ncbi:MAG: apolipoprotein N-acyltransferase [Pseudomonadota bacterium]